VEGLSLGGLEKLNIGVPLFNYTFKFLLLLPVPFLLVPFLPRHLISQFIFVVIICG